MKRSLKFLPIRFGAIALSLLIFNQSALADSCYYAYKAKRDNPLQLHYGVIQVRGECDPASARSEVSESLQLRGWSLLVLLERVNEVELKQYKERAGEFYLRY